VSLTAGRDGVAEAPGGRRRVYRPGEPWASRPRPWLVAAGLAAAALAAAFAVAFAGQRGLPNPPDPAAWLGAGLLVCALVVAHEGLHAVAVRAVGGQPTLGWTASRRPPWLVVWVGDRGRRFPGDAYLAILLVPLTLVLAALAAVAAWPSSALPWLATLTAVLLAGGDAHMAWKLAGCPRTAVVTDLKDDWAAEW
jgi:Putative zincin peptidase